MDSIRALGAPGTVGRRAILVVEDEALLRMDVADEFAQAGLSVLEAGTADDALLLLEGGAPVDLIFSDIRMPGSIDGIGLRRVVRTRFAWISVVLASANQPPMEDELVFIPKPYLPRVALQLIFQVLARTMVPARSGASSGLEPRLTSSCRTF